MKYYLGIDIGGTKCAIIIGSENSDEIIDKIKFETNSGRGYKQVINDIIINSKAILSRNNLNSDNFISCGVSCGGPLDSDKGIIMSPPNLSDWNNIPLAEIISAELGISTKIRNDADACAIAEWKFGAGKGCNNFVFLTFGTGMGAGLILDGKPYSGTTGTAGEAGHIRLTDTGPIGYGKEGSFEGYCSGGGIQNLAQIMLEEYKFSTTLKADDLSAKSVASAAKGGDLLAINIYKKSGYMLGRGLSVIIDLLNPQRIIIGSIFQRSSELLIGEMQRAISEEALTVNSKVCEIIPSALGDKIGDYAALGVAKEYAEADYE